METEQEKLKSREALRAELGGIAPPPAPAAIRKPVVAIQKPEVVTLKHNDRCPALRGTEAQGFECTCAANLQWLVEKNIEPLERKKQSWVEPVRHAAEVDDRGNVKTPAREEQVEHVVELWRVDKGRAITKQIPAVTGSTGGRQITKQELLPPRWVCTSCGWAVRGSHVSHRCDKAAVALATRQQSISELLTRSQRFSGEYRLIIWRDQDQRYHVGEEFVEEGFVVKIVELAATESYDEMEGVLLNEFVERFSP